MFGHSGSKLKMYEVQGETAIGSLNHTENNKSSWARVTYTNLANHSKSQKLVILWNASD